MSVNGNFSQLNCLGFSSGVLNGKNGADHGNC